MRSRQAELERVEGLLEKRNQDIGELQGRLQDAEKLLVRYFYSHLCMYIHPAAFHYSRLLSHLKFYGENFYRFLQFCGSIKFFADNIFSCHLLEYSSIFLVEPNLQRIVEYTPHKNHENFGPENGALHGAQVEE